MPQTPANLRNPASIGVILGVQSVDSTIYRRISARCRKIPQICGRANVFRVALFNRGQRVGDRAPLALAGHKPLFEQHLEVVLD